ncbi:hypothetical protein GCM10027594_00640 [Hymenobacter agri]|uniref:Tetratricopeptide repeat protein n=1 Tax=Hymenobacter jeollabukensis TaxID=2025313 RepID=A0A5R8WIJ9_9BACT|nr:hypothetical protein [Hymenobacter jeollabukensis]TLM88490.1 hypothetical protein FDY95_24320 [Hymenobacter jeollabukensis]
MQYDTRKDIVLSNVEQLGKQMLHKGCSFILKSNFAAAFSYISDGYDLITCDCPRGSWFTDTYDQREAVIQLASLEMEEPEFHFCLSFALFYISLGEDGGGKDMDLLTQSLKHIDEYLSYRINHLGYYFKGRVLSHLGQRPEAIAHFDLSFKSKVNTPALYRASLLREHDSSSGLYGLYQACLSSPSSVCAWEHLHDYAVVKRGIAVPTEKVLGKPNTLASQFNDSSFYSLNFTFWSLFKEVKGARQPNSYRSFDESLRSTGNDAFIRYKYDFRSDIYSNSEHLKDFQDFVFIMGGCARLFNEPAAYGTPVSSINYDQDYQDDDDGDWGGDIDNNEHYNDDLDMDQQSQEFWDNL